MAEVSYEKLWNKLKENNMQKTDFYRKVKISTNAIAKMDKNQLSWLLEGNSLVLNNNSIFARGFHFLLLVARIDCRLLSSF